MLTIGDIKLDTFIQIEAANVFCELNMPACQLCIEHGKKIPVQDVQTQIAGSAPNVAVGIAKMGKKAGVYSLMGEDILHTVALDFLQKQHVDTSLVRAQKGKTTPFAAVLNFKGESTQLVANEPNEYCIPTDIVETQWIHVSELGGDYDCLFTELLSYKKEHPDVRISFNPGVIQIKDRSNAFLTLLPACEVVFVNRAEARDIAQQDGDISTLLQAIHALGPHYVVITDGREGAYAYDGEHMYYAPMFPGERVEATGAGDAFATGFLGAMLHGKTHDEALAWGSANAAQVVQFIGPTAGLQSAEEISALLRAESAYSVEKVGNDE